MKPKKADLSITIIIAAVIGLIALVVVIAIFTNTTQKTAENINSCVAKGGICADADGNCFPFYPIKIFVSDDKCRSSEGICCLKAGN